MFKKQYRLLPALAHAQDTEWSQRQELEERDIAIESESQYSDVSESDNPGESLRNSLALPTLENYSQTRSSGWWGKQSVILWTASDGTEGRMTLTVYEYGEDRIGSYVENEVDGQLISWIYRDDWSESGWMTRDSHHLERVPDYANIMEGFLAVPEFDPSENQLRATCSEWCNIAGAGLAGATAAFFGVACGPAAIACHTAMGGLSAVHGAMWVGACKTMAC